MASVGTRAALVVATVLSLGTASCGGEDAPATASASSAAVEECQTQWQEVAANLVGLDEDPHPSGLAKRWSNILATVAIYQDSGTADQCQENIEEVSDGITELRQFSTRLQPYDMEFQADQVAAAVARYLAEPLPAPQRRNRKVIAPPSKAAVTAALATLNGSSAGANEDLAPAWEQLAAVSLDESAVVASALQDLDFFAKDSTRWVACNKALSVLRAAIAAQQAASGATSGPTPGGTPTPTPSTSPTSSGTPSPASSASASSTPSASQRP